jgi:hypothetical protein
MGREEIVAAIKRLAIENGGRAPSVAAFERATGVKPPEWYPHIWGRVRLISARRPTRAEVRDYEEQA